MTKTIEFNGKQVIDFTPGDARAMALVDLEVLKRLTNMLDKVSFTDTRHSLREKIMGTNDLSNLVSVCEGFVAFHKSVNLIQEFEGCNWELTSEVVADEEEYNPYGDPCVVKI
jgi:hypothetical protein